LSLKLYFFTFEKKIVSIIPLGAIGYSCPIRLVPTYILFAIDIRILGRLHSDSFKTERLAFVKTDRRVD